MTSSLIGDGKGRAPTNRTTSTTAKPQTGNSDQVREDQIITALAGRYDELEALWKEAEEELKRFRVHAPVILDEPFESIDLSENGPPWEDRLLGFFRYGKGWHICYGTRVSYPDDRPTEATDWTPISDCSVDERIRAIPAFEKLRQKVVETAEASVPKLDTAIASFRKILKG